MPAGSTQGPGAAGVGALPVHPHLQPPEHVLRPPLPSVSRELTFRIIRSRRLSKLAAETRAQSYFFAIVDCMVVAACSGVAVPSSTDVIATLNAW